MERTKYDKEIKTPFMFGWIKCECCGNEFRFERMYRFKTLSFWKAYTYRYGCQKCFNTKEGFYKYMVEKDNGLEDEQRSRALESMRPKEPIPGRQL